MAIGFVASIALGWLLLTASPAEAQVSTSDELTVLGANALLGGGLAGIVAAVRGKPVLGAVAKGTIGGITIYAGKHMATYYQLPSLGLPGRVLAATGASMVRNGAAGRGTFDVVVVPLGPLTLYRRAEDDGAHAPVKLNLLRTAFLAALILRSDTRIDWQETLYLGAPFYYRPGQLVRVNGDRAVIGLSFAGAILVSDRELLSAERYPHLVAHERVHVLQDHFAEIAVTGPVEHWLMGLIPGGEWLRRYVDPGILHGATMVPLLSAVPYRKQPWEIEADHFADRYHSYGRAGGGGASQ